MKSSLTPAPTYHKRENSPRPVPRPPGPGQEMAFLAIDDASAESNGWLTEKLSGPRVSLVVPVRPGAGVPGAVKCLDTLAYSRKRLEVVVARGCSPSRQRNEAVEATR